MLLKFPHPGCLYSLLWCDIRIPSEDNTHSGVSINHSSRALDLSPTYQDTINTDKITSNMISLFEIQNCLICQFVTPDQHVLTGFLHSKRFPAARKLILSFLLSTSITGFVFWNCKCMDHP